MSKNPEGYQMLFIWKSNLTCQNPAGQISQISLKGDVLFCWEEKLDVQCWTSQTHRARFLPSAKAVRPASSSDTLISFRNLNISPQKIMHQVPWPENKEQMLIQLGSHTNMITEQGLTSVSSDSAGIRWQIVPMCSDPIEPFIVQDCAPMFKNTLARKDCQKCGNWTWCVPFLLLSCILVHFV